VNPDCLEKQPTLSARTKVAGADPLKDGMATNAGVFLLAVCICAAAAFPDRDRIPFRTALSNMDYELRAAYESAAEEAVSGAPASSVVSSHLDLQSPYLCTMSPPTES
jgi:hypothetical protein